MHYQSKYRSPCGAQSLRCFTYVNMIPNKNRVCVCSGIKTLQTVYYRGCFAAAVAQNKDFLLRLKQRHHLFFSGNEIKGSKLVLGQGSGMKM